MNGSERGTAVEFCILLLFVGVGARYHSASRVWSLPKRFGGARVTQQKSTRTLEKNHITLGNLSTSPNPLHALLNASMGTNSTSSPPMVKE